MIYYQSNSSHSQTPHYFPTKVVFSKHGLCLFWVGVFFFPQVCWSFLLQADLGSISAHMLIGSQWSIAKQHGCRCWCCTSEIWAAILVRSWSKQRPWPGHFSPSANQWASLSFMLKLIGWWHLDSLLVRYRSRSSIKMLTRCKIKNTSPQKMAASLLSSQSEVGLLFGSVISCGGHNQQFLLSPQSYLPWRWVMMIVYHI